MTSRQEDESIQVHVTPTFARYLYLHYWALPKAFWLMGIIGIPLLFLFLATPFLPISGSLFQKYLATLPAGVVAAMIFGLLPASIYFAARKRWHTVTELREPHTIVFTDAGMQIRAVSSEGFTSWQNIVSARRMGTTAVLATAQKVYFMIPMDAFASHEHFARLRRLLESKVPICQLGK